MSNADKIEYPIWCDDYLAVTRPWLEVGGWPLLYRRLFLLLLPISGPLWGAVMVVLGITGMLVNFAQAIVLLFGMWRVQ